jgi:hypothetical protein
MILGRYSDVEVYYFIYRRTLEEMILGRHGDPDWVAPGSNQHVGRVASPEGGVDDTGTDIWMMSWLINYTGTDIWMMFI